MMESVCQRGELVQKQCPTTFIRQAGILGEFDQFKMAANGAAKHKTYLNLRFRLSGT